MSYRIKTREEEVREYQKARDKAIKIAEKLEQQNEDLTERIKDLERKLDAKQKKNKVLRIEKFGITCREMAIIAPKTSNLSVDQDGNSLE